MTRIGDNLECNLDKPDIFEIKVRGHLDKSWSEWLEGMTISYEDSCTVLTGKMMDQSALRGLLIKVWDLNQTLVSVNKVEKPERRLRKGEKTFQDC
jgi:hypothetical protein